MRRRAAAGLGATLLAGGLLAASSAPADPAASAAGVSEVIGHSVNGAPIVAQQIGDLSSPRVGLVVGVIHGNESSGLRATAVLHNRYAGVAGAQLWVIDVLNVDGLAAHNRVNARGVDLNRNFPVHWRAKSPAGSLFYQGPFPGSEPETQAAMAFSGRIRPDVSIWYHQALNRVIACPGPKSAARYAKLTRMRTTCTWARLPGTAIRWTRHRVRGSDAFVVELHGGRLSAAEARRHARAAVKVTRGG